MLVPFHRFVAAHGNLYKMTRYMNGYRLLYFKLIRKDLKKWGWGSGIEKDPMYPIPALIKSHWTSSFVYASIVVTTTYFCFGGWYLVYMVFTYRANYFDVGILAIASVVLHVYIVQSEFRAEDVRSLKKQGIRVKKMLKEIRAGKVDGRKPTR